jgi:hypothetical protein
MAEKSSLNNEVLKKIELHTAEAVPVFPGFFLGGWGEALWAIFFS